MKMMLEDARWMEDVGWRIDDEREDFSGDETGSYGSGGGGAVVGVAQVGREAPSPTESGSPSESCNRK